MSPGCFAMRLLVLLEDVLIRLGVSIDLILEGLSFPRRILVICQTATAMLAVRAMALTTKNAVGLCVVGMGASTSANCGTVMMNMIHSASV